MDCSSLCRVYQGWRYFITFRFPPNFFLYFFPIATNQSLVMEAIQVLTAVVKFYFPVIRWAWSRMQRIYLLFLQAQVEGTCWCLQGPFGPAGRASPAACTKGILINMLIINIIIHCFNLFVVSWWNWADTGHKTGHVKCTCNTSLSGFSSSSPFLFLPLSPPFLFLFSPPPPLGYWCYSRVLGDSFIWFCSFTLKMAGGHSSFIMFSELFCTSYIRWYRNE